MQSQKMSFDMIFNRKWELRYVQMSPDGGSESFRFLGGGMPV